MSLGNRLRNARKRTGYTQKQLAEKIGAKHNSVSNWENGLNMPDPVTIEALCGTLGVTPNYLLMGDEIPAISRGEFTSAEIGFLNKYRMLDQNSKGAVDTLLDYYSGLTAVKAFELPKRAVAVQNIKVVDGVESVGREFEVITGMISSQSVAAGTGTYLDKDSFDNISVQKNDMTRIADFYVPVSGDSMEPRFHDADILIIAKAPVKRGEIGVFTLDGSGFVKVLGDKELISLNPDYDPIPMNDDIVCNGKVIGVLDSAWIVD